MNFHKIVELEKYLDVAHHIPGRIRVKFSPLILTRPAALAAMKEHSEMPDAIKDARVNMSARSVVIEYDPDDIRPELIEELIQGTDKEKKAQIISDLYGKLMKNAS
ncbi:HMA2 domain-containing protein [Maridesulfovibrio sp.]|uniref:HMA2 domain-containing protein n=1 Tax=Maridesulfovibrio sp. TaxID=2795000 RepID=UPI0029CA34EA|nr:heavy-metal-associated domain-containing protein [Maridesulfovibrio sp.]